MPALSERWFGFWVWHYQPSGYTGGFTTQSDEHNLFPGPGVMIVHCGLTFLQPNSDLPFSAAVGVQSFGPSDGPDVDFGPVPMSWDVSLSRPLGTLVMGFHVVRGDAKGWYYIQHWA